MGMEGAQLRARVAKIDIPADPKEELFAVAIQVFAKNGFNGTSIRDITSRLGVSVSNVYNHFKSKEALWIAIQECSVGQLLDAWERGLSTKSGPVERFALLVKTHLAYYTSNLQESKILGSHTDALSSRGIARTRALQRLVLDKYLQHLEELREAGYIAQDQNLSVQAFSVLGILNEYLGWYKPNGVMAPEEIHQEIFEFICAGLLRPTPERSM